MNKMSAFSASFLTEHIWIGVGEKVRKFFAKLFPVLGGFNLFHRSAKKNLRISSRMNSRPRVSSVSSSASSSSSISSYYGFSSGISDVELTNDNDTSCGGGGGAEGKGRSLEARTLFDDVKVILRRHDRKLMKLEDDLMFMVRWLHEKFDFVLKSESTSSFPSGYNDESVEGTTEDGPVFSEDDDESSDSDQSNPEEDLQASRDFVSECTGVSTPFQDPGFIEKSEDINQEGLTSGADENRQRSSSEPARLDGEKAAPISLPSPTSSNLAGTKPDQVDLSTAVPLRTFLKNSSHAKPNPSASVVSASSNRPPRQRAPRKHKSKADRPQLPAQCDICGKFLKDQCTLRQHKQIHLPTRPFPCPEPGCGKSFRRKFHLQTHLLIHQGVRKHQCGYCGRLFLLQKDLVSHERIHTGERPFQCPQCPKSFTLKSHLVMHVRVHTKEKPYKCDVCSKHFSQSNSLRIHKKKVHQPNKPNRKTAIGGNKSKRPKKKSGPQSTASVVTPGTSSATTTLSQPPPPAKLPLYRNQGKILNYLVPTGTLTPITILQPATPVSAASTTHHQIEIVESIVDSSSQSQQGNHIILPTSTLSLVPSSTCFNYQ